MKNKTSHSYTPSNDDIGKRLDRWLKQLFPQMNQAFLEKALRKGLIQINGKKVKSSHRLSLEDRVETPLDLSTLKPLLTPKEKTLLPLSSEETQWLEGLILWEDDQMIVLNKPSGLATQGGTKTTRHVDGLFEAYGLKTKIKYRLTHRLDRDTSGLLLIAKTSQMATFLTKAFKEDQIQKTYLAVVKGRWPQEQGTINQPLKKLGAIEKMVVDESGQKAITHFRLLRHLGQKMSLLSLKPETGRTHQLRVHTQFLGHPILGDGKYGGKEAAALSDHLMLHSFEIKFKDPDGAWMTFRAPLPDYLQELLNAFKFLLD